MSLPGKPWSPPVSGKQMQVLADRHRFLLMSGPRYSTKTMGGLHRLALEAWNTNRGHISMVGITATDNADGGAWSDLHNEILPKWFAGGFGMRYVRRPKLDGATHKLVCDVTNKYGNSTRIQLDSLPKESEVEHKFKGKRYSMIYATELSNFKSRLCFDVWQECLRMVHLEEEERRTGQNLHFFLGDTNPAEDGEDSWIYKLFWGERLSNFEDVKNPIDRHAKRLFAQKLGVHEFTIDDNIWMTDDQKAVQRAKYLHSQDLYDRYYRGLWKKASGKGLFSDVFSKQVHVIGDDDAHNPEILMPEENCSELGTGWDIGSANNAAVVIEPVLLFNPQRNQEEYSFKVLDEYVKLGQNTSVEEVTENMVDKVGYWNNAVGAPVRWEHVSDRSAFERYENVADAFEHQAVYRYSEGLIELREGPVKKRGSVQARVNLVRKLLFENRLYISSKCTNLIETISEIRKGNSTPLDPKSKYKHVFDALTYYICLKCFAEMEAQLRLMTKAPETPGPAVVRIPL